MYDMCHDAKLSLKLPTTLKDRLLKRADLLKLSPSKVLRQALEAYLQDSADSLPESLTVQVRFLVQLISNVDSLDQHRDFISQQMEVLKCLTEENHSQSSDG